MYILTQHMLFFNKFSQKENYQKIPPRGMVKK